MATSRKKKAGQDQLSPKDDPVLAKTRDGSDGTDPPITWAEKVQAKAKAQDESYIRGWLRAKNPKLSGIDLKNLVMLTLKTWKKK